MGNAKKAVKKSERNNPVKKSIRIRKAKATAWHRMRDKLAPNKFGPHT